MSEEVTMINLTIDGKAIAVPKGTTVYNAAKKMGIDIPVFCYHDRMPPFGACRVCLVEVEKMPKLQTSCTLEATEGMVVHTQNSPALKGREGILEFLLINHPLDCPICDRGGECPLQENAIKCSSGKSRFYEEKRRFKKPVSKGPLLMLDRERCIVCARCTRFGDLVAGDHALELVQRGFRTEVGTPGDGPAESKFIGNTIMICPVGALTSQVYRFRARPWDNESTPSTCTLCPVGCSLQLDSRDGEVMRTRSCENRAVNDIWLCDKGWFGYEFSSHPDRLQKPMIRKGGVLEPVEWEEAIDLIVSKIQAAKPGKKLAAVGGSPLTVEENYLLQKVMRIGAGVSNVDYRVGTPSIPLDDEGVAPGMEISIGECEELSFALLLGIDLTEEFPVIWLRLKQAINRGAKVIFIGHYAPEIAKHLSDVILHPPGKELETLSNSLPAIEKLVQGKGALFVGSQYLAHPDRKTILAELLKWKRSLQQLSLNLLEGRGNSMGARLAGMHPELGPMGERLSQPGLSAVQVIQEAGRSGWDFLYVVGANPAKSYPSKFWEEARAKLEFLVVQDLFLTETARQADVVLPALCFLEKRGRMINIEGRVQHLKEGKEIPEGVYSDFQIFISLAHRLGVSSDFEASFQEAVNRERIPFKKIEPIEAEAVGSIDSPLRAVFAPELFDNGMRMKHNPHLIQMAKEPRVRMHPGEAEKRSLKEGQKVQLSINGYSLSAALRLDERVAEQTVVLPLGFDKLPVHECGVNLLNGAPVEIALGKG